MSLVVRILTNCRRRKRVYNVVILIAIACVLILCFQFFLFGAITVYQDEQFTANRFDRGARPKFIDEEFGFDMAKVPANTVKPAANIKLKTATVSEKCVGGNCSAYHTTERKDNTVAKEMNVKNLVSYSNVWAFLEHEFSTNHQMPVNADVAQVNSTFTRGVNARWQPFYVKDETGFFTCIMSHEKIPFSQVNDDYCDCSDHSDEPGTSACSNGRFYCLFQSTFLADNPVWLPSSRVNDGLCDCCDGSDEWANHTIQQPATGVKSILHTPCVDRCQDLRLKEKQMEELRQEGKVKKQEYIKAGMGQSNPDELYGTDAAFFKLRTVCSNFQQSKYSYSICPFGPVSQTAAGESSVLIGQRPHWIDRGPKYRLALEDGTSTNCPALSSRRTLIDFECGVEDRVLSVSENEVSVLPCRPGKDRLVGISFNWSPVLCKRRRDGVEWLEK